jgi:hypothetical protein
MFLEETGLCLDASQWARLEPYATSPNVVAASSGQLRTQVSTFARRGTTALGFDHTFRQLVLVTSADQSGLCESRRFKSNELAIRAFLSNSDSNGI